jgi:hypothetical protein
MEMIAHQTPAKNVDSVLTGPPFQMPKKVDAITRGKEYLLTVVAALGDVMRETRHD